MCFVFIFQRYHSHYLYCMCSGFALFIPWNAFHPFMLCFPGFRLNSNRIPKYTLQSNILVIVWKNLPAFNTFNQLWNDMIPVGITKQVVYFNWFNKTVSGFLAGLLFYMWYTRYEPRNTPRYTDAFMFGGDLCICCRSSTPITNLKGLHFSNLIQRVHAQGLHLTGVKIESSK